jgi:hypothetical protein
MTEPIHEDNRRDTLAPKDRVDGYLKLYAQQMAHYESTQSIEWKVSIVIWTLLALGVAWATRDINYARLVAASTWTWLLSLAVVAHATWLWLIHASEEKDKELWCMYRASAEKLLGIKETGNGERSWHRTALWILLEAGVTAGIAAVLWHVATA